MMLKKNNIRKKFIKLRNELSPVRRSIASKNSLKILKLNFSKILSFAPKSKEINLWPLNKKLAAEKRLYLPKVNELNLDIFEVTDLDEELIKGKFNILEPDPTKCKKIAPSEISCILVPAIVFDKNNNRLGFGRGYYDRFLQNLNCTKLGVGFLEQLDRSKLPHEIHDIKLDHLFLF
ncbi:MAG: 5-formyltetrahydrofolate cyclo-ligase [Candidatus Anoxychlamydiales bacterium]|nr:5-formyltetrahydrofolate cyclo-ligase [Candidatus Anoxychlamydiales bacterium]NGX40471.1 5-formyltetrahydrofolate cyclo-ligase [Candidatus Anoxychlamydiales bacterium]HEU64741.1 5-formyltetrahydrofolate cyclo-ligase [Chlamydiota bacterium]